MNILIPLTSGLCLLKKEMRKKKYWGGIGRSELQAELGGERTGKGVKVTKSVGGKNASCMAKRSQQETGHK